jgi:hypothetical protein
VSRRKRREIAQALVDLAEAKQEPAAVLAALIRLAEVSPLVLVIVLRKSGRDIRRAGLAPDLLP